ncbi:hypothetical protein LCGC14_2008210 [marine sediment metagenome]|uniref:Dehydrogenase E1 component domain-containing protein n=1 Tax=marine sediment metagenome TaxID=412755 RepID=A0A0F9HY60_9ZZZZ
MPQSYKGWTASKLIAFEREIADLFEAGEIRAPVHLHGNNEGQLIDIFAQGDIGNKDVWCFGTHRAHYHALLKGVPPELVKAEILKGNSISLQFPEYHFHTSAIVGGILPIALGVAMCGQRVWCFVGEMAERTGIFHECLHYAHGHDLPIRFVVENNGLSVETPTDKVWDDGLTTYPKGFYRWRYTYERTYPHQGASGKRVTF